MATIKELSDELEACLDYEEVGSVEKAQKAITLCRKLRVKRPTSAGGVSSTVTYTHSDLVAIERDARKWAGSKTGSNDTSIKYISMRRR